MDEKPKIIKIDLDTEIQKAITNAMTRNEQRKVMRFYILDNLRGTYTARDGRKIVISNSTADKFTHNASEIKLRIVPYLVEMIKTSTFKNIVSAYKTRPDFEYFAYYKTSFELNSKIYVAEINVGITAIGESTLYEVCPIKEQ